MDTGWMNFLGRTLEASKSGIEGLSLIARAPGYDAWSCAYIYLYVFD